jgi:hypothetical protein
MTLQSDIKANPDPAAWVRCLQDMSDMSDFTPEAKSIIRGYLKRLEWDLGVAMSEHSPAPWHASRRSVYVNDIRNRVVAEIPARAERVANAHLIAAAPDLYSAIRNSDDAHWTPAMRTAMAKAEGRS